MERNMVKEHLDGQIMRLTKETSMIIIFMVLELINGLMGENILENGE